MDSPEAKKARAAVIRPATDDDLDLLVAQTWDVAAEGLWTGVEVPFDRDRRRSRFSSMLTAPSSTVLVADTSRSGGPGVVGYISVEIASYGVADIGMLLIVGWRGMGLGKALLDAAVEWAASRGAHKMAVEVWPHNSAALELYRRAGFAEEGRKLRHYRRRNGELWDAVLMGRQLG